METVGQQLRVERLRRGLTLEQLSATTRISLKNLEAIENDRLDGIGSAFFYKSFVRQFAGCVSLRYEDILPLVLETASIIPEPEIPGRGGQPAPRVPPLRRVTVSKSKWAYSVVALLIVLASCSTLNAVWHGKRFGMDVAGKALKPSTPLSSPPRISREAIPSLAQTELRAPLLSAKPFHVEIVASQPTWLSIMSDGKTLFSSVLQSGQTRSIEGHQVARVRAGNAGGVTIQFNGKSIGLIGSPGQVRTVVFTKDKFEVVGPSTSDKADEMHFRESGA